MVDEEAEFERTEALRKVLAKLQAVTPATLEELFCSPEYFGITTASPLQRAICRVVDGLPLGPLAQVPEVIEAFGGPQGIPAGRPVELDILSAIRAGKSLLVAALVIHWTQTCDVSRLGPGEIARVSVVSLKVDLAQVVYSHIVGNINASPKLRRLLVAPPTADSIMLRHPTGKPVEIKVVAGTRAGASLVARWSAGCVFDEYTRMVGSEDGAVNYEDSRAAVLARLLPGAQIASIGSPWASTGPAYSRYVQYWGKANEAVCIVKAPGWVMNPVFWTKERVEGLKLRAPNEYRTDCAAEFGSPEDAFFAADEVRQCTRNGPPDLDPMPTVRYVAAMDPATRGNAWTLVVAGKLGSTLHVACVRQWQGSTGAPLDPKQVLEEIAQIMGTYGIRNVLSDQVMGDALRSLALQVGIRITHVRQDPAKRLAAYTELKFRLQRREVDMPPDKYLREDLLRVRKRPTPGGAVVHLPETPDGRHCDYAPSLTLALGKWLSEVKVEDNSEEAKLKRELAASKRALTKRYARQR